MPDSDEEMRDVAEPGGGDAITNPAPVKPLTSEPIPAPTLHPLPSDHTPYNDPDEYLLTIPGANRDRPLLPIPPHLVGEETTWVGHLKAEEADRPVYRMPLPKCDDRAITRIVVGPRGGYREYFVFGRRRLMSCSDFFAAIYSEDGALYKSDKFIRCYDIPIGAMRVIFRWFKKKARICRFDNRPNKDDEGVHILYVWQAADFFQMNGLANAAADIYQDLLRDYQHHIFPQDIDFMYDNVLQHKPLFQWMLSSITFDYANMRLPDIYWSKSTGYRVDMAEDEDLVPDHVLIILRRHPEMAVPMLYMARRQQYLGWNKIMDPILNGWDGTESDTRFCRRCHDHRVGTRCVAPSTVPGYPDNPVKFKSVLEEQEVDEDAPVPIVGYDPGWY